ncbi:TetR/AcrR family transcriptional regulator [Streptomyces sp. MST-110588]|uniref:TetR/AcrR family transcriptional regulator n=1 Tax=Streptomyces sp. MST-110588 TaxID=2833628 RepID=UPI001F5C8B31|nr:TetR/AcrR family transcriptional regulator [Streptomyces sp. MST-110588]UNO43864.1 TetR family transcriptional regulator [Streptomyces sp. MST-110588]
MTSMASARTTAAPRSGAPRPGAAEPGTPKIGLRERKKIQTRKAIRRAAYRLFKEQGYEATPVDQIAEAADVSPSTVFRYFPTKEDIVLTDEYDQVLEDGLRARPAGEPMVTSIRHVTVEALRQLVAEDRNELIQRILLVREVPALRGRTAENTARDTDMVCGVLAERSGRAADDLEIRVVAAAILAALQEALMHWVTGDHDTPLEDVVDGALDVLARGLTL